MHSRTKNLRVISKVLSLVVIVMLSCDAFKDEDDIPPEKQVTFNENVFYILPGSSVVIDLNATVKQSFTNGSLIISQDPLRGRISRLDTQFLKYKPADGFTQGEDEFIISVSNNGNVLTSDTVTIIMVQNTNVLPCPLYTVEDKVHVKPGSPISISFLENDRLCGTGNVQVSIQINPQFGEARLIGDSVLVYTPAVAFTGRDQLVYKLSSSSDEAISYGIIAFSTSTIKTLRAPDNSSSIFFVDEKTGFLGGGGPIYKTIDGGETWNVLLDPPFHPYGYCSFDDLFFLDANNGFATYLCDDGIDLVAGGLISTTDGGVSWKKLNFDLPITSVFFTSTTTGFIGVDLWGPNQIYSSKFFKTEDGGLTWREIFSNPFNTSLSTRWKSLGIQFINFSTGYALREEFSPGPMGQGHMNRLFVTSDGGETWTLSTSSNFILSIALAPENIATVVLGEDQTAHSSIVRSQDATTWHTVADFPYVISRHKFSPSGDLGIALGISSDQWVDGELLQVISINKSVDKGATWVEEQTDEPLYGPALAIAVPSDNVAYILCYLGEQSITTNGNRTKIIKYIK